MFAGDDEDGDFLSPSGGAKLASLFGLDQQSSQGNESFQYTAPKQPRKNSNPAPPSQKQPPPSGAPAVLLATAVQAFRYINGQYVKQGKLGAAALGNHATKEYKLLLYLSQQKQVTSAKIHAGLVFTVQPNNYCTFYDDQRQNWSLMFESEKASSDFCQEVCLAKANSAACLDVVVVQDLNPGEGQGVENGDSLEVVYTGWLLQNHTIGQMFDSNRNKDKLLRIKLGAGKVIKGWEEGLQGMKKSGRRLIVVPPNLAYGSKGVPNCIPPNSTLIFEAELRRVKFSKDSGSDRTSAGSRDSAAPSPAPSPAHSMENLSQESAAQGTTGRSGEAPLRAKSNSLSEQLANPDVTKAKLISRMAKMGQPMLPFMTGVASQAESSDSELEDTSGSRAKDLPSASSPVQISTTVPASTHVHPHPHTAPPLSTLLPVSTVAPQPGLPGTNNAFQPYAYAQTSLAPSQLQHVSQLYPAHTLPYMGSSDVTSFLMTEARQHNTEIRLAVGKVADKVDQLNSKIDDLQRQGSVSMAVPSMLMETSMIVHNIQRIVQENECLKKEVFDKSSRIEEQNVKIGELINQNQRSMEQSHLLLEQRNDSMKSSSEHNQARLLQAEQDKVRLTEDLAASAARLSLLQLEASSHQQKSVELQGKLNSALQDSESHCQSIATLERQLEELKETAERSQSQYRSERQRRKETELKVNNMEEELQDLRTDKEALERTLLERKKKWQAECRRRDEELEELRKNSQQDLDNLRAQLRKARTSTDTAASEQLSQLQAELEEEWRRKCEQMLTSAKEQHRRDVAEVTEQRDAAQDKFTQLQEKFTLLKQSRDSEEQIRLQRHGQTEELQALHEKFTVLERKAECERKELEDKVAELEKKVAEQMGSGDTAAEVKRVMNGVFHSLRAEFDLSESYSGQAVLGLIVTTIKNVTLQLLSSSSQESTAHQEEKEEEEEEEGEKREVKERGDPQNVYVNGDAHVKEEEEERHSQIDPHHDGEETFSHLKTQSRADASQQEDADTSLQLNPDTSLQLNADTSLQERADTSQRENTDTSLQENADTSQQENADTSLQLNADTSLQEKAGTLQQETFSDSKTEAGASQAGAPPLSSHEEEPLALEEDKAGQRDQGQAESRDSAPPTHGPDHGSDDGQQQVHKEPTENREDDAPLQDAFGPPRNPPPPPEHDSSRLAAEGISEENGTEPFFPSPVKPGAAAATEEEEEEEEMSLKGRPPPAPLFGEDEEDDDDLDWLS